MYFCTTYLTVTTSHSCTETCSGLTHALPTQVTCRLVHRIRLELNVERQLPAFSKHRVRTGHNYAVPTRGIHVKSAKAVCLISSIEMSNMALLARHIQIVYRERCPTGCGLVLAPQGT